MTTRFASIIELKSQPGQKYLVAHGCPHPRPNDAPFYACACGANVKHPVTGVDGFAMFATCNHLEKSSDAEEPAERSHDRVVECSFDQRDDQQKTVGSVGTPVVSFASGDSDGGSLD